LRQAQLPRTRKSRSNAFRLLIRPTSRAIEMSTTRLPNRRCVASLAGSVLLGLGLAPLAAQSQAQTWPSKPVRFVIGAPAGGTVDIVARLLADGLQKEWGQSVFVEAKPGGAGTIGVNELMMAPSDGHTLYVALNGTVSESPQVLKVRYQPFKDLKPLVDLGGAGLTVPMIRSGKIKAFAVSSAKRNAALPEVPTFAEQGFPMIDDVAAIFLWVKAGVPTEVQARVREATLKVLALPATRARMLEFGFEPGNGASPEDMGKALHSAYDKQGATLRALGVKPQELPG
jgi:tripartite-type tricarboxylate transporter receptor subunit TctC